MRSLKMPRSLIPPSLGRTLGLLPRIARVLQSEGAAVLARKVRRRLAAVPLKVPQRPTVYRLPHPYPPLKLAAAPQPRVSIVVPLNNAADDTYHCLFSIQRAPSAVSFEVIVVDDGSSVEMTALLKQAPHLVRLDAVAKTNWVDDLNLGAGVAKAEYLVFVNSEAQVQAGWLDALVAAFDKGVTVGLVGGQILSPDGRLQEAGRSIRQDGSIDRHGFRDLSYRPEYSYLRAVDCVSDTLLAIRQDLFVRLNGFDQRFRSADYASADLAFRARQLGFRILYQPECVVVRNNNSIDSDSETAEAQSATEAQGDRSDQADQARFLKRWNAEFPRHEAPVIDIDHHQASRQIQPVLIIDSYLLMPDRESGSQRMVNMIEIMQQFGCKVTFAASNLEAPQPYVRNLQQKGVEVLYRPCVKSIRRHLAECGGRYEMIVLSRADTASRSMADVRRYAPQARCVFDTVDLHFLREQRYSDLMNNQHARNIAANRRREELSLIEQADTTLVVSSIERDLLKELKPSADIRLLSNIHQVESDIPGDADRSGVIFIGAFAHPPNIDAVLWFCQDIWPLVVAKHATLTLSVIGAEPPRKIRALASERVHILGQVEQIAPYFRGAKLSVAPLRYGAGVKGKINQSLANGLPVVATTMAAEGMFLEDGASALLADSPEAFAHAISRLIEDQNLWRILSAGGLEVTRRHFSFEAARSMLATLLRVEDLDTKNGLT
ncbi:MAG: glycosyltransferase [Lamprobacter sp.]|uniref:glycosyltransferase n=1 Tax=Lamprobacter sp. TaxID=3100796 RepID=UPI002B262C19|nr:glycosyltransferase [Lamprobacter sp.]MEA3638321.1 glycosyltransferase [Lamprobacter sp.]